LHKYCKQLSVFLFYFAYCLVILSFINSTFLSEREILPGEPSFILRELGLQSEMFPFEGTRTAWIQNFGERVPTMPQQALPVPV